MTKIILGAFLAALLVFGACESEEDYLSVLEGLEVTTTSYHDEVMPPPPGSKFPPTFYEPMLIDKVLPSITGSVTLQPDGQSGAMFRIEPDLYWYRQGQTLDFLFVANKPVLWQLNQRDTVNAQARFGSTLGAQRIGLLEDWGFFYEGEITEIQTEDGTTRRMYSTALRVIAWEDAYLELTLWNNSPYEVEVYYSVWEGDFIPYFADDYLIPWVEYYEWVEDSEAAEEEFLEMKQAMEEYLRERWPSAETVILPPTEEENVPPPAEEEEEEEVTGEFSVNIGDLRDQITVVEWPTEAHRGEYITVRVKIMSEEYHNWLRNGAMNANDWESLTYLDNLTYSLELESPQFPEGYWKVLEFAYCTPDDQLMIVWYCAIPTQWQDGSSLSPGVYKLWLKLLDPCDYGPGFCGADVMVERNILIK